MYDLNQGSGSDTNLCDDPPYTGTIIPIHVDIMNVVTVGHLPNTTTRLRCTQYSHRTTEVKELTVNFISSSTLDIHSPYSNLKETKVHIMKF